MQVKNYKHVKFIIMINNDGHCMTLRKTMIARSLMSQSAIRNAVALFVINKCKTTFKNVL